MNKELIGITIIAMIFFGTWAVAAESGLYTFTLGADQVLTDYIRGNVTADQVNITGLIIQAGQVLGYYNKTEVDAQINMCFVNDTALLTALNTETSQREDNDTALQSDIDSVNSTLDTHTGDNTNPHSVTAGQTGAAAAIHSHAGTDITSEVPTAGYASSCGNADTVDNYHASTFYRQGSIFLYKNTIREWISNAGGTVLVGDDDQENMPSTAWTKTKEIRLQKTPSSSLKIYFWMNYLGSGTCYARIYRNGAAVGTQRSISTGSWSGTETISGWSDGDLLQLYTKDGGGSPCVVNYFRILGTVNIHGVV